MRKAILAAGMGLALAGQALAAQEGEAEAPRCKLTLQGANVWTGAGFERRDVHVDGPKIVAAAPAGAVPFPAQWTYLVPPLADTHVHGLDEPEGAGDPIHAAAIAQGIFYALNPNNIRRDSPGAPFGPDQVEAIYAGGGLTGPGGHPRPLYEMLALMARQRGVDMGELPGRAFHEVSNAAEVRAAVERVQAQGSNVVKLYLLDHRAADSKGLSADLFAEAVAHALRRNMRPIVHVETAADFRLAANTPGLAAIVHLPGTFPQLQANQPYLLTAEDAALAARNGIGVATTLAVAFNHLTGEKLARAQHIAAHNLTLLRDAQVNLTAGADRPGGERDRGADPASRHDPVRRNPAFEHRDAQRPQAAVSGSADRNVRAGFGSELPVDVRRSTKQLVLDRRGPGRLSFGRDRAGPNGHASWPVLGWSGIGDALIAGAQGQS